MFTFSHRWFSFQPSRPRSTLMKVFCGVVGLVLLAVFLVFGLLFGLGVLIFSISRAIWRSFRESAPKRDEGVIDGEFRVVRSHDDLISSR